MDSSFSMDKARIHYQTRELSELITMGDGSNDIPMLEAAGLSIAWHAKPKVRPHAKQAFDFAPLSGVLALFD